MLIYARTLSEASSYESSFVFEDGPVRIQLFLEVPPAGDDFPISRSRYKSENFPVDETVYF